MSVDGGPTGPEATASAMRQDTPPFDALQFVMEAQRQGRAQIEVLEDAAQRIDRCVEVVSTLQTDLADAKTALRAIMEAAEENDLNGCFVMAKTFLGRFS